MPENNIFNNIDIFKNIMFINEYDGLRYRKKIY